jgi:hypothetical protein
LGLDSLWMAFAFPPPPPAAAAAAAASLPPSAAAGALSPARVSVVRECAGLHLGAHSSSCTGGVRFSICYMRCVLCGVT